MTFLEFSTEKYKCIEDFQYICSIDVVICIRMYHIWGRRKGGRLSRPYWMRCGQLGVSKAFAGLPKNLVGGGGKGKRVRIISPLSPKILLGNGVLLRIAAR